MRHSSHTFYQAQLPHDHLFTNSKKQLLAKYWIESNLGIRLVSSDFCESLKDGEILCKIIEYLVYHGQLPNKYRASMCNLKDPSDKINLFLKAAKHFGLQDYHLFSANDLLNGENMNNIASTILILVHVYSCKRFAGKSIHITEDQPKRSESYTVGLSSHSLSNISLSRSKSETILKPNDIINSTQPGYITQKAADVAGKDSEQGFNQENSKKEEVHKPINIKTFNELAPIKTQLHSNHLKQSRESKVVSQPIHSSNYMNKSPPICSLQNKRETSPSSTFSQSLGEPPYDIQRPNCIPGFGSYDINNFKNEEIDQVSIESSRIINNASPPSSINSFDLQFQPLNEEVEYEEMYDTHQSHTPSTSGDSGYGTTRNKSSQDNSNTINHQKSNDNLNKAQDLFEALFAPVSKQTMKHSEKPSAHVQQGGRLSLLFSKAREHKKKEPHFVKFQTWSNNKKNDQIHSPIPASSISSTIQRPHEEKLFYTLARTKSSEWENKETLPPVIKIEDPTPLVRKTTQQRARRRTDASLFRPEKDSQPSITENSIKKHHTRSRSIGSALGQAEFSPVKLNGVDGGNNLDIYDDDSELVARYKLGNVIGKGHFGTVYRALDLISGNTVAIKQVSLKDARKSDIEDMMQEASLLKSLTHSNIVKYEGFIQTEEHMNIVLEYVENGSLLHTLKHFGNSLPEHLVASYCHDILQGLAYLHKKDVVHCDLKAANILTTKTGNVKLSDFGVSLNLKLKNQQDNLVAGTPFWMSPEVIELKGASVQSDIWSLGCTIIELCTGKPPYADLLTMTAMFKIVEDDSPPFPEGISDDLQDFLRLCFKKNPIERPKAVHLLHHPWILQNAKAISQPHPDQVQVNSIVLKSYAHKVVKKDDISAPNVHDPLPKRTLSTIISLSKPTMPTESIKAHGIKSLSNRHKSFISHLNIKSEHKHNLTICSFPSGTVQCKLCNTDIHNEAYVCKDFCGYISHCACYDYYSAQSSNDAAETFSSVLNRRKTGETKGALPTITGPKPTASVSSQLKEKFSFGRKSVVRNSTHTLSNIIEDNTNTTPSLTVKSFWWKKKSLRSQIN